MITQAAFRLLAPLTREQIRFAVFLLANFDLRTYCALSPQRLLEFNVNGDFGIQRGEKRLYEYIDSLVTAQFLEYGPFVRGWGKQTPTVRIQQRLLMGAGRIRSQGRRVDTREDRAELNK
jgi:hypothetical protein